MGSWMLRGLVRFVVCVVLFGFLAETKKMPELRRRKFWEFLEFEMLEPRLLLALDFGDAGEGFAVRLSEDGALHAVVGSETALSRFRNTLRDGYWSWGSDIWEYRPFCN
jgi:hypothetical protein